MEIREIFASNLRRARHDAGLSQEDLAFKADLDRTYVSSLERGLYSVSIDVIARLAEVLSVDPSDLLLKPKKSRSRGNAAK